jgi:hypothetical protein
MIWFLIGQGVGLKNQQLPVFSGFNPHRAERTLLDNFSADDSMSL